MAIILWPAAAASSFNICNQPDCGKFVLLKIIGGENESRGRCCKFVGNDYPSLPFFRRASGELLKSVTQSSFPRSERTATLFLMKGIILAGGTGSRLFPLTLVAGKQLQPVYDKPMVYYPLATLIENGIREFCLISSPQDLARFGQLLGDGKKWGVSIEYREQSRPGGIAQSFLIAESFIGSDSVTLILGDNIFYGGDGFRRAFAEFKSGATIFGYHVNDPERYGVVEFDSMGHAISIEEKPKSPKSNYAVPGLYLYDNSVLAIAKNLQPSSRGELEITDVNLEFLRRGQLHVQQLSRGFAWLDAGTSSSLHEASAYVQTIEKRQGIKIGCPEEAAFRSGFLTVEQLESLAAQMPNCEYRDYLARILREAKRSLSGN